MQITEHITSLLYRYECVVIPDFGAFLTERQPAEIDETTHAFYPPKKTISFNRQLKKNDGLLTNYIAKVEAISYEQSSTEIRRFVNNLLRALDANQRVSLDKIGAFYTQGDKILFQPLLRTNYLLESFGTASFTTPSIERTTTQPKELTLNTALASTTEGAIPLKKHRTVYWKYAAVGLIALSLGSFTSLNWYSNRIQKHNLAAQQEASQQIENRIQQATFIMSNPLPEVVFKVNTNSGKYHIVAGAFREKSNAEEKLAQLQKEGFQAQYIGANKYGLHQVIYNSFNDRRDAINALNKIRKNNNSHAWLLVKEL